MKFSVVIPAYNAERTISRAIESCLLNGADSLEIVIVNDCSTDSTADICSNYSDRISYFEFSINSGVSAARNFGVSMSKHDWVLFLDADDYFYPYKVSFLTAAISRYPDVNFFVHDHDLVFRPSVPFSNLDFEAFDLPVVKVNQARILLSNVAVTPSFCFKKSIFVPFDINLKYCEDYDFILRISETINIYKIPYSLVVLGHVPLLGDGLSSNRFQMRKGEMLVYKSFCKRNNIGAIYPLFFIFSTLKYLVSSIKIFLFKIGGILRF